MPTIKQDSKRILMVIIGVVVISSFLISGTFNFQTVHGDSLENLSIEQQIISPKASEDNVIHIDGRLSDNLSSYYSFINGSGTWSDPYILADMHINSSLSGDIIYIENVVDYFHITNMTLISAEFGGANIKLNNCENISIFNNKLSAQLYGISLFICSNILVYNNSISSFPFKRWSDYGRFPSFTGVDVFACNQINISNNQIMSHNYGISVSGGDNNILISNNLTNNNRAAIATYSASTLFIIHNNIINNENGVFLVLTEDCVIDQNLFDFNNKIAIDLYSSKRNNISSNIISNSRYGVAFEFPWVTPEESHFSMYYKCKSINNILSNNTLTDISIKPIKFWLGRNEASDNYFEQNIWSVVLFFVCSIAIISSIIILPYFIIKRRTELKRKLKAYEGAVDQKDKIEALEKELEDYKQKFFELKANLK